MNHKITLGGLVSLCLMVAFTILLTSVPAEAAHCSTAASAGMWDYTYTGTIFTSSGPLPAASVGHFRQDAAGKLTGSQTRSVAGGSGVEDISGNITVRSETFRIVSEGKVGSTGARRRIEAIVQLGNQAIDIISYRENL